MKLKYIAILALPIIFGSCKKFLEPDSISTFDTKYVYANVDDTRKGVNAAYEAFGTDGFRSRLSNNMTGNTDIEHSSGWSSASDRYQIWDLNALSTNGDLRQFWNAAYTSIRNANIAIEGIQASDALKSPDPTTTKFMYHMMGEAYTIRAYWYSMLIYYFGDVPNVREAPKAGMNFYLPREDRNVILSQVIDDLKNIEEKNDVGRTGEQGICTWNDCQACIATRRLLSDSGNEYGTQGGLSRLLSDCQTIH